MAKIEEQVITHEQVRNGVILDNDPYQIGAVCLIPGRVKTFLSNPNLDDESEPLIVYEKVDGAIMGREIFYPTKMKIGDSYIKSYASSSLFVSEEARKYMLGASLVMYQIRNYKNTVLIFGGMTKMAVDLYKKLKFTIFDIPSVWQFRNARPILQYLHFKGVVLNILSLVVNLILKTYYGLSKIPLNILRKKYNIVQLNEVPDWLQAIVDSDNHKYAEYHGKEWFNWVINTNFGGKENDKQNLYGIFRNDKPLGFVLLTEREGDLPERHIDKINFGTVCEWGTIDEKELSEYQIYKLALSLFSSRVDIVTVSTTVRTLRKKLHKYGFINHGNYNVAFKSQGINLDDDSKLMSNWRIRSSYSDTCFY